MKKSLIALIFVLVAFFQLAVAQIPLKTNVAILKAEDARRYDTVLQELMRSPAAAVRKRAALAAGRIGDASAVSALISLLDISQPSDVRAMAAFAIGEIESEKGAEAIFMLLTENRGEPEVLARAVEAAGKIAAANPAANKAKALKDGIRLVLNFERSKRSAPFTEVVLAGITAALRTRLMEAEDDLIGFTRYSAPRVRQDALNTLARLRSKEASETARNLLQKDEDAVVRANAARVIGAAEDKTAVDLLLNAALTDSDQRVRVSALRSLGNLKDAKTAEKLISRAEVLQGAIVMSNDKNPAEISEMLELIGALGRISPKSENEKAFNVLNQFRRVTRGKFADTEIALARISPEGYLKNFETAPTKEDIKKLNTEWQTASAIAQGLAVYAESENAVNKETAALTVKLVLDIISDASPARPDVITALAAFKQNDIDEILRKELALQDIFVRASTAGLIAERPLTKENFSALETAFTQAFLRDKTYNDALLAIMDALVKLDKKNAAKSLLLGLSSYDQLVRKKALEHLQDETLFKDLPGLPTMLEAARKRKADQVQSFAVGSKLGVLLNSEADYRRAAMRRNGGVKAVITTDKGAFTIDFTPEDAPLTVDNFIKLARSGYFNGASVHRIVPNFVMQDGDPRGDGNGGPGWSIRCEINILSYERGAVGMALSGKDTGGSQWFVTHSPQPHLNGGYTVFGKVSENDMKIVDSIVRGDKIISIMIKEIRQKSAR